MIPPFDETGYLPAGIHRATLDDIENRFGRGSELRQAQFESVRWMVELAVRAGASRIILNGSFVTDRMEPNDVDRALLFLPGRRRDHVTIEELQIGLPFLDISIVDQSDFDALIGFFSADRSGIAKGVVEVIEWN